MTKIKQLKEFLKKNNIFKFSQDKKDEYRMFTKQNGWELITRSTLNQMLILDGHDLIKNMLNEPHINKDGSINNAVLIKEEDFWVRNGNRNFASSNDHALPKELHKLSIERKLWVKNDLPVDASIDTSPIKKLISSVCGHKEENILYLEKWLLAMLNNPFERCVLPSIMIYGTGGTGKGVFQKLISTMLHGHTSVAEMNINHLSTFTDEFKDASVIFFDEISDNHKAENDLKKIIGAEFVRVNVKNQPAYKIPNNIAYIFTTNSPDGALKLSDNDGVNRRWGVIKTADYQLKEATNIVIAVKNRDIVQTYISELIAKHGAVMNVKPLHGADYKELKNNQGYGSVSHEAIRICEAFKDGEGATLTVIRNYLMWFDEHELKNRKLNKSGYYTHKVKELFVLGKDIHLVNSGNAVRLGDKPVRNIVANSKAKITKLLTIQDLINIGTEKSDAQIKWEAKKCS